MGHRRLLGCTVTGSPRQGRVLAGLFCGVTLLWGSIASGAVWTAHGPDGGRVTSSR
jgi:hypothetical protein